MVLVIESEIMIRVVGEAISENFLILILILILVNDYVRLIIEGHG